MNRTWWVFHPISIFILSILALGTSLFLYIYWYIEASTGLKALVRRFDLDSRQVLASQTWVVILVLSILVGIILLGILVIFFYNQKTLQLFRLQNNFINNFTHELKTPVTSLQLFLETFLKHDLERKDRQKYVDYMLQDVNRLSENINRILNLAKLEAKSYEGEFIDTDLAKAVNRFLEDHRRLFAGTEIQVHPLPGTAAVCAVDRPLFAMLLMNLIKNAISYNASETAKIDITFESANGRLYIRFADNGIGFDRSETKKLFKKFYQSGRSESIAAGGSGLGLYLVQNIVRIHKWRITAKSAGPGQGAVFTVSLPFRKA